MQSRQEEFYKIWKEVSKICKDQYGIVVGNNAAFVAETIFEEARKKDFFAYVECGVYKGTTFFPIYHLCKILFEDFAMYALDSFSGFPEDTILNKNDEFEMFETLCREDKISRDHLERARERCSKLKKKEHIQKDYFRKYDKEFFRRANGKREVNIIKCSFSDLGTNITNGRDKYDLVFWIVIYFCHIRIV